MHQPSLRVLCLVLCTILCAAPSFGQKQTEFRNRIAQSNIYEVNLRQFSAAGNLAGFEKQLPRLKEMGVEIIWFMPVTPIGIKGRKMNEQELGSYYAVQNYKDVNPEFGTLADFKKLVRKAHKMGFWVITDWVANHTALDNPWVTNHPDFYMKDSVGGFVSPFDWTDVLRLDYQNPELRDSMIDAMRFWIRETDIDGFRCDVAELVPDDFWESCIRSLRKTKPIFMLAEGNTVGLHKAGFDETYNWNAMHRMKDLYEQKITPGAFIDSLETDAARFPKNSFRLFFTSNHDENSWNGTEFEKYGAAADAFAVLTQTMYQSIPLVYNGQEEPNKKRLRFFVKDPIGWKKYTKAGFYKTLHALRRNNPALAATASYERCKTDNKNVYAYFRTQDSNRVLTVLNLSGKKRKVSIRHSQLPGTPTDPFTNQSTPISASLTLLMPAWGYRVLVY